MLKIKFKSLLEESEKRGDYKDNKDNKDYSGKVLELVKNLEEGARINIKANSMGGYDISNFGYKGPVGSIIVTPLMPNSSGKDPDAYEILGVDVDPGSKGSGPLFYDIALEIASMYSRGLTSDRQSVSDEALPVWEKYYNNRSDVTAVRADVDLDSENYYLEFFHTSEPDLDPTDYIAQITPENTSDDILQISALKHKGFEEFFDSVSSEDEPVPKFKEWSNSPLSYIYKKKGPPVVLKALKDKGAFGTEESRSIPKELWDAIK